jgi:tetratricopeptide (TPR) repeat protein
MSPIIKQTNIMKLIKLVIASAMLLGLLAGCSSPEEKAAAYVANGDQLFIENNLGKAAIEYKNALQINQNLPDAWYGIARIHERKQEWKQAYGALSKIRETNPDHVNGRIMLAQILLASNQIDQALEDAKHVLEIAPNDARAHSLMAAVQFRLGNFEAAQKSVERALDLDPTGSEAILVKARVLISEKKYDEAIAVLDAALQATPDNASLYLMKIQVYSELDDKAAIEQVFRDLVQQFPDNIAFKHALMRQYIKVDNIDQAEQLLQKIVDDNPANIDEKVRLVSFKKQYRSVAESIELTNAFIKQYPSEYQFRFTLAELYLGDNNIDGATEVYNGIIADDGVQPSGLEARNKLALTLLKIGKRDEARKLVDEVLANDANDENALLLRAGFRISERNYDDAIVDLRTVLRDNPTSIKALGMLGQAYSVSGSTELAIESLGKAFSINPQVPAIANAYANLLMRTKDPQQASEVLEKSIAAGNQSADALKLLTQAKLMLGEFGQAEQLAQKLKAMEGQEALSEQLLGLVYQGKKQPDESEDAFKRAHELAPESSQPVVALVTSYIRNNQIKEAKAFLQTVLAENENNTTAYLLLGQLSLRENDTPAAIDHFERVIKINPKLDVGYRNLASIYFRGNKPKDAERVLRDGLTELPGNATLTLSLASVYETQKEFDKAIQLYENLLQKSPDLIVAKNNLASLLTDYRQDQESHDQARKIAVELRDSSVPQFRDTYAWAAVKSGNNLEEAIVILEGIVRENEQVAVYTYHLGEAYRRKGDTANAIAYLDKAAELAGPGSAIEAQARASREQLN